MYLDHTEFLEKYRPLGYYVGWVFATGFELRDFVQEDWSITAQAEAGLRAVFSSKTDVNTIKLIWDTTFVFVRAM